MASIMARGLVLGGGGVLGLAWETGVLHGLAAAGVDLRGVDEVIGTSAGAFAATALLDERGIGSAFARQRAESVDEVPIASARAAMEAIASVLRACGTDTLEAGRRIGRYAMDAATVDVPTRLAVVRDRLDRATWPSDRLRFTAIDVDTGHLELLDAACGIDIVLAAAASGAAPGIWPVIEAGGRRWVDGGSVSVANAALASRYRECLVVAPRPANLSGVEVRHELEVHAPQTRAVLLVPDADSAAAMGGNFFDPSRRREVAQAGFQQGLRASAGMPDHWLRALPEPVGETS